MKIRWTQKEIKILRDDYENQSREDLCKIFPNKTWIAIKCKARSIGVMRKRSLCRGKKIEERFWYYMNKKSDNQCWCWSGTCNKNNYGVFRVSHKNILAHRFCWMMNFGDISDGLFVCHHCDNPSCVNPSHLFLGTQRDNIKDMIFKNRHNNGKHKLDISHVKQIRNLKGKLTQKEIGKMFDIHYTTVGYIHRNQHWRHIE